VPEYQQTVTPTPLERPPVTIRPARRTSPLSRFLISIARPAWAWRLELTIGAALIAAWAGLAIRLGRITGSIAFVLLGASIVVLPSAWLEGMRWMLHRSRVRRRFGLAVRYAGLATHNDRVPHILDMTPTPAGDLLRVRVPAGATVDELAERREAVAAFLEVRDVRVLRDPDNARLAEVTIMRRDPLTAWDPVPWPYADAMRLSLWYPIPVGVDESGEYVYVTLPERNVLTGGEPGSGKSVANSMLVATAALDPEVRMTLFDGKRVELACWAGCADRIIGPDIAEAVEALEALRRELDERLLTLLANRRRKIALGDGMALHVVVIDELAFYCNSPDRKLSQEFAGRLRDLVSRGRAAGIIVLAATQKPSSDVIPTSLRDLFGFRWALRCLTPQASDTVLGSGWASLGYSASTIDAAARGVGLLLHEGGLPVRMRACHLTDDDLVAIADRAEALRAATRRTRGDPDAPESL
jgi:FtsK/SpoIIIE family